ncbi:MAG: hypothetical protein ABI168_03065 [Ginsengibacter sp.]
MREQSWINIIHEAVGLTHCFVKAQNKTVTTMSVMVTKPQILPLATNTPLQKMVEK